MSGSQNSYDISFERRQFCSSLLGLLVSGLFLPELTQPIAQDREYLVLNGWVLTRNDIASLELPADVIRLQ